MADQHNETKAPEASSTSAVAASETTAKSTTSATLGGEKTSPESTGSASALKGPTPTGYPSPTSLVIQWEPLPDAQTYAVQMTTDPTKPESWQTLSKTLKSCAMRKKNLSPAREYFFRVRGVSEAGEWASPWTSPSQPIRTAAGINPIFRNLLGGKVLKNVRGKPGKAVPVDLHEMGSGLIALYFSASWCPPCRQFTPRLEQFHSLVRKTVGPGNFEVAFVSSDRDPASFNEYFANHHGDWYALPFESQRERQQCGSYFKVEGIPRLIVFGPDGKIVSANAVGESLDMATYSRWRAAAGASPQGPSK